MVNTQASNRFICRTVLFLHFQLVKDLMFYLKNSCLFTEAAGGNRGDFFCCELRNKAVGEKLQKRKLLFCCKKGRSIRGVQ